MENLSPSPPDETEDRRVRADSEPQRQHRRRETSWLARQRSRGVAKVHEKVIEPHDPSDVAAYIAVPEGGAKGTSRFRTVTACQRDSSAVSCFLPAAVSSYARARRPLSFVIHSARIQPASSIRCRAG